MNGLNLTYTQLLNDILNDGNFPQSWNIGYIVNLSKSGDHLNIYNYRGITINSNLGKLFSSVILNRLKKFTQTRNLLVDNQISHTPKARTSNHLFIIKTLIDKYAHKKVLIYACFIDLKKFSIVFGEKDFYISYF